MLTDEMLARFSDRAPIYDRENRFFSEDFEELRRSGYLIANVPKELGGGGLDLAQLCRQQRRLAYHAAPTALAVNMHLYWLGVAGDLWRAGDRSLEWVLRAAVEGEIFAAGHAETGNDLPVLLSTTKAEKVSGGYKFTGRKSFGSLTPVWTYLGMHGMDVSDPAAPRVVHAFVPRASAGMSIGETWDVMGMRATKSEDTLLEGVYVPDRLIARTVPAGPAGLDPFIASIFAWALLGFGNIYYGLARRAFDVTVSTVKKKTSLAMSRPMAYHAGVQHAVAEMSIALEGIEPHIERIAEEWVKGVDHGTAWGAKIVTAKYRAVEESWRVVDLAMEMSGGFGIFRKSEIERLFRDARLGRIHPANSMLTHEWVAKTYLGVGMDETPRWG
ncbi:MAG TPA: acyl-CoA dehydrogenase family protein [Thermoanaerobaculia bacterium]|nr:acyl-CoA dehydrogenase family protein [Thermoanaerobaculia bacterium]